MLEAERADFDMRLELAVKQKEAQLSDLRKVLEVAYEDIAQLEAVAGEKSSTAAVVKARLVKIRDLETQVAQLEAALGVKEEDVRRAAAAAAEQQATIDHQKEGMEMFTAELERMGEERGRLEDELKRWKAEAGLGRRLSEEATAAVGQLATWEAKIAELEAALQQSEAKVRYRRPPVSTGTLNSK